MTAKQERPVTRRHIVREERGASLVELVLVLGVLLLMITGIVDLGRAFHHQIILTNASREGARYASRFPADSAEIIQTTRDEVANSAIPPADVAVTITGLGASGGQPIRVTATYNLQTILGGLIGTPTLTLRASTEMIVFGPY